MEHQRRRYAYLLLGAVTGACGSSSNAPAVVKPPPADVPVGNGKGPCQLTAPAFCDTFDAPSPGGRGGDLDDLNWSASRISTMNNPGQVEFNEWPSSTVSGCGTDKTGIMPPNDMFFCAGGGTASMHFNDGYNDFGGFTIHSYRVRRPFDFADRTGVIAFDVGAKSQLPEGHGWWCNIFIADEPVPAPYQQGGAIALYAKGGVGFEFESTSCSTDGSSNALSAIYVEKDYKIVRHVNPTQVCFKTKEEVLNHVEIHVSQAKVEVFVADFDNPTGLRTVGVMDNADLPLSRGYVNFQHTQYNGSKAPGLTPYTTYHWDNIGFDGPSLPTPRAYELPDTSSPSHPPEAKWADLFPPPYVNTGYELGTKGLVGTPASSITLDGVNLTGATNALLTFTAWLYCDADTISYRFNGGAWRTVAHPFPECDQGARALSVPVDLADLKAGSNTIEMMSATGTVIVANGELTINTN